MKETCSRTLLILLLLVIASVEVCAQSQAQGGSGAGSQTQDNKTAPGKDQATDQGRSNDAQQYDKKSFEVLTGVGAVLAGVEDTSYKIDNDALAATNIGRKRIELLLGGGFIMPFRRGGRWIEDSFCADHSKDGKNGVKEQAKNGAKDNNEKAAENGCRAGGDTDYKNYRPWETFLSIRFAPGSDQTINGFVVGGGYRITKYFSLLIGYSVTPRDEPSPGFRLAASQIVANNPTIFPYNRYNPTDLLQNKPGAFDGFPLFIYNANGATTQKLFLTSPTVTHYRSGTYFGVGIPLNLTSLFKPSSSTKP